MQQHIQQQQAGLLIFHMATIASEVPNFPTEVVNADWTDVVDRWGEGVSICTFHQEGMNRQPRSCVKEQVIATALDLRFSEDLPCAPMSERGNFWEAVTKCLADLIEKEAVQAPPGQGHVPVDACHLPGYDEEDYGTARILAKGRFVHGNNSKVFIETNAPWNGGEMLGRSIGIGRVSSCGCGCRG